ncbi:MAG: thermonuclease family protein [Spirochaetaceae bacterium]|jgi:micrococcal nuclease|nr:thermonuclease family protein [Spirochaetaceae bacterium]
MILKKTAAFLVAIALMVPAYAVDENTIVYRTRTGKAYHAEGCGSLSRSKIPVTLADAAALALAACPLCSPPALDEAVSTKIARTAFSPFYRVNIEEPVSFKTADTSKMLRAVVGRHIDGDTVELQFENPPVGINTVEKIRMIGVDTPETVHPHREVEFFGKEASEFTKNALLGKTVFVAFDWDMRDKYGRLLVYIYTAQERCHNAELIRQGYAHAYTRFPFRFLSEFRALEQEARAKKRGLWQ